MYANLFSCPTVPKKNNFTLIRMLCCFIVIYEHSVGLSGSNWLNLGLSSAAVATFFILSDFWVTYSLLRSDLLADYAKKRFKKIFPLYWSVVIFFALVLVFTSSYSPIEYFTEAGFWKYLAANQPL
ncbi:MAG: hypothetical protein IJ727_06870 [Treponema sp.]|nr:hypothetical protein [Treponema sp.]